MNDRPKVSVSFSRNKTNSNCSRFACVLIYIVYLSINKTNHALLRQNVCANDAGSRPLLSDPIMAFSTINQPRVWSINYKCMYV